MFLSGPRTGTCLPHQNSDEHSIVGQPSRRLREVGAQVRVIVPVGVRSEVMLSCLQDEVPVRVVHQVADISDDQTGTRYVDVELIAADRI